MQSGLIGTEPDPKTVDNAAMALGKQGPLVLADFGFLVYVPEVGTVSPTVAAVVIKPLNNHVTNKHNRSHMCEVG